MHGPVPSLALLRAVKDEFDPEHRMAPGRARGRGLTQATASVSRLSATPATGSGLSPTPATAPDRENQQPNAGVV